VVSSLIFQQHNYISFHEAAPDLSQCWRTVRSIAFEALYAVLYLLGNYLRIY